MNTFKNVVKTPFLIETRHFATDNPNQLNHTLDKMYFEVAYAVNSRIIGIFDQFQVVTGERWFNTEIIQNKKQSYRQVYPFGAITAGSTLSIDTEISGITQFTKIYGTCITNVIDYRPIPYASISANANIELNVTPGTTFTINIKVGAGSPNITSGIIVIEYLLN